MEDVMSISSHTQQPSIETGYNPLPAATEGDHWIEPLRDGTPVLIRPLRATDRQLETDFIRALSLKSRRQRFLCDFKEPSQALVDQMMNIDYEKRMAFIALIHHNGKLREIGVSRYCATTDQNHCECAVTVADDWQNRGLGTLLMKHLVDEARRQGFKSMISVDSASNHAMRDLARYLGFSRQLDPADPTQAIHTLDL
jgi:GNAT superfamily N-acetyltransferase